MAGGHETLNLIIKKTSEFMDQPFVQQDHVVTVIPPATNYASTIASSNAAATIGFQTLNSPCEGVGTAMSTSGAANNEGRSRAPRRPRPCSPKLTFDFCSSSIQILLLVVFLSIYQDEHPHMALRVWAIGYGAGCLAMLPLLYCSYKRLREQSNRLPQVSPGSEVDQSQTGGRQRFGKILKWLWRSLNGFFVLWFGVGVGIVDTRRASKKAPRLNMLCTIFLVFLYFRFVLPWTFYSVVRCLQRIILQDWLPRGAEASVISALPTYKFGARETRVAAVDQVVECCICLDSYEDGVELKELPACAHHFHVHCIDRWLKINGSCPICKSEVGRTSSQASTTENRL